MSGALVCLSLAPSSVLLGCSGKPQGSGMSALGESVDSSRVTLENELWRVSFDGQGKTLSAPFFYRNKICVAAGSKVYYLDPGTGDAMAQGRAIGFSYGGSRVVGVENRVVVAYGDGGLAAFDAESAELLWRREYDFAEAVEMVGHELDEETGEMVPVYSTSPASWYVTDFAVHAQNVYIGFSSYQANPGSYLLCVAVESGEVVWQKEYLGRFCFNGGVSHPCSSHSGLLVPKPEENGIELLDYATGGLLSTLETDGPIGMGFARLADDGDSLLTMSRCGTLYGIQVQGSALEIVCQVVLPCEEKERILPSSALPVVHGSWAYCNCPVEAEWGTDGFQHPIGECACVSVDLRTFKVSSVQNHVSFDSTPLILADEEGEGAILYSLQSDGLMKVRVESGSLGRPEFLDEEVSLSAEGSCGPFVLSENGIFVCVLDVADMHKLVAFA